MQHEFWPGEVQLSLPLLPPVHGRRFSGAADDVETWLKNREEDRAENQRNYRR